MRSPDAQRRQNKARELYDKENTKQVKFKFNLRTDADILERLYAQPNIQGYIKRIIREDIARDGKV